jgi:hypothetical protein
MGLPVSSGMVSEPKVSTQVAANKVGWGFVIVESGVRERYTRRIAVEPDRDDAAVNGSCKARAK